MENWKPIKGYEGWYEVSDLGNVRSVDRKVDFVDGRYATYKGQLMKQSKHYHGYWIVNLFKNKKQSTKFVHRLMAEAFIPNPNNKQVVNHKDGDKANNKLSNLEWVTQLENITHSITVLGKKRIGNKVSQYDLNGNYLNTFESYGEAAKSVDGNSVGIGRVVSGERKTYKGFVWKRG
jgi:hypothetical protein